MKLLLSCSTVLALVVGMQFYANRGLVHGGRPPELSGQLIGGEVFDGLDTLRKPAVVYFWASWCGICKAMQGTVRELAKEVPIITVATQSGNRATVKAYLSGHQIEAPVLLDEDGTLGRGYGVRGVPALFILDRDGRVRYATTGFTSVLGIRFRLWLAGR